MPPGRIDAHKVRAFVDHLANSLGREPYWDRGLFAAPAKPTKSGKIANFGLPPMLGSGSGNPPRRRL
jgi:hypothetical protein